MSTQPPLQTLELSCRWSWKRRQIELFIKGAEGIVPTCKIGADMTPTVMITNALTYASWAEGKFATVTNKIFFREAPLKMQYYQARRADANSKRPVPSVSYQLTDKPSKPSHVCALQGRDANEYCNGSLRVEGVPDVIGEIDSWKAWRWDMQAGDGEGRLVSPSQHLVWEPLTVVEAKCSRCPAPPCTNCTCGLYAGTTDTQAKGYGDILGKVKQWGRFVQGNTGAKSQFAYPSEFLLQSGQEEFIEKLQMYGVPIKMMAWVQVWDPCEAGFGRSDDSFIIDDTKGNE